MSSLSMLEQEWGTRRALTLLLQFTRSIASNPRLGEHIRSIDIQITPYENTLIQDSRCNERFTEKTCESALRKITKSEEENGYYLLIVKATSALGVDLFGLSMPGNVPFCVSIFAPTFVHCHHQHGFFLRIRRRFSGFS